MAHELTSAKSKPPMALLRRYLSDWRSLFPGGSAGVLQLMYPPLGAAIAAQSGFFDDPFARVYRSIPQIWSTVLLPDGAERAIHIRDLHRAIRGTDDSGKHYHALDPETFWWAHATFTWEVFEAIRLFFRGGLGRVDIDRLYAESLDWYDLYGVRYRDLPPDYGSFCEKFDQVCRDKLEMTPAARCTLDLALAGKWRLPLVRSDFKDPLTRGAGRVVVIGALPGIVRERFDLPFSRADERRLSLIRWISRWGFGLTPHAVNRRTMGFTLRYVGAATRPQRYLPPADEQPA